MGTASGGSEDRVWVYSSKQQKSARISSLYLRSRQPTNARQDKRDASGIAQSATTTGMPRIKKWRLKRKFLASFKRSTPPIQASAAATCCAGPQPRAVCVCLHGPHGWREDHLVDVPPTALLLECAVRRQPAKPTARSSPVLSHQQPRARIFGRRNVIDRACVYRASSLGGSRPNRVQSKSTRRQRERRGGSHCAFGVQGLSLRGMLGGGKQE